MLKCDYSKLRELVKENLNGALDHLSGQRKILEITKLTNALWRNGLFTAEDICKTSPEKIHKMRLLGGNLARTVVTNIRGNYDELKYLENRLDVIDREIEKMLLEKETILRKLKGGM